MRARVLVVDDDVAVRTLLSVVLADDSWDVVVASTIEEALRIVHDGGHAASEPGIVDGLVRATDEFAA